MKYHVYFLANKRNGSVYIGVTNNITKRVLEHKSNKNGFCYRYNIFKLVYYESFNSIQEAILREKQFKNWHREWKINLIESSNPEWMDLCERP